MSTVDLNIHVEGNGCTEDATMLPSYYDMMCMNKTVPPVLDIGYVCRIPLLIPSANLIKSKVLVYMSSAA